MATTLGYAPRSTLVGVEAAFPLWIWGVMFLVSCAALAISLVRRWHSWIWCAHVALSVLYLGLTVGLAYGYFGRPWFDGIRTAAGLAFPASLHALLWWRMGFQPLDDEARPATFGGARA